MKAKILFLEDDMALQKIIAEFSINTNTANLAYPSHKA